jgi:metallo-beta-lactamase family protein
MRVEFLGGVRTVTGSATLLEKSSLKWLVDCGMFQGGKEIEGRNRNIQPYSPKDLSFILLPEFCVKIAFLTSSNIFHAKYFLHG